MSTEPTDEETERIMAKGERVLDVLIDSYRELREKDAAVGAQNEFGALGGVQMLAEKAPFSEILLSLAVRRLAGREAGR